ncbi:MAG: methyltransferase, partial [Acidimicrobiales bacterium]
MLRGIGQLKRNQAALAVRLAELERRLGGGERAGTAERVDDPRFGGSITSRVCTQAQFEAPWFDEWCAALGIDGRWRRKVWEHAYIAHVMAALGADAPSHRGLGFGVGREPMVAYFAGRGNTIVATDLDPGDKRTRSWAETDQHAAGQLAELVRPELCDPADFATRVTWRAVDMNEIPGDLDGFDFCWSACSLEHLGTLAAGLDFVERSLATLRPGGIAVHTTEFNVDSDDETVTEGPTVLYRRRDLIELARR